MEAFSLLKYWRGSAVGGFGTGAGGGDGGGGANLRNATAAATTIVTTVTHHAAEEADDDEDDDDGPFFDLEFTVQDEAEEEEEYYTKDDEENNEDENESQNDDVGSQDDSGSIDEDEEGEEEREFKFTISSNSSGNDRTDQNLTLSPSDDLFFKGKLVPIEPSSLVFNSAEPNSKPQFAASLLKSATKFRVSMLRFKKSKQNVSEKTDQNNGSETATTTVADDNSTNPKQHQKQETEKEKEKEKDKEKESKFFTVKFKVDEVPIKSLFTRENNSSRKSGKQNLNVEDSEEKKFSKDVMQKYLKKVKPLYIRVSKRYGEKLKFSGQLNLGAVSKSVQSTTLTAGQKPNAAESTADKGLLTEAAEVSGETFVQVENQKQVNNIPERLKVVCKQLGKSRSASSAVAAAPPAGVVAASRRDDSLLQQQDGIQSAILHCKRSFNASRDSDCSLFGRSVSDPFHQKFDLSRKSSDQGKDGSFESS